MLVETFIKEVLRQLKAGIENFNDASTCKALMPELIELDLAIITIDGIQYVCSNMDTNKNISRLKFTIYTANYPWLNKSNA